MLMWSSAVKVFFCPEPVDLRKSFDGLCALTRYVLRQDPLSGHLFVFVNKRGNLMKILFFDRTGFALFYKRLEKGTFRLPRARESFELPHEELALILEGFELASLKRRKRLKLS